MKEFIDDLLGVFMIIVNIAMAFITLEAVAYSDLWGMFGIVWACMDIIYVAYVSSKKVEK